MKAVIMAPLLSQSGYGEHARLALSALEAMGADIYTVLTDWGSSGWISDKSFTEKVLSFPRSSQLKGKPDLLVTVDLPDKFMRVEGVPSVGMTAGTESTKFPRAWEISLREVDKVVVPSSFTKEVLSTPGSDIKVVPFPKFEGEPEYIELGLKTEFNFLSVGQACPRKNLGQVVDSFLREFSGEEGVGLVLKMSLANNSYLDQIETTKRLRGLKESIPSRAKVYLVHGDLSESQMMSLYSNPKIKSYVTASKGEGFGIPLLNAMQYDLSIVAPMYSGYTDFISEEDEGVFPVSFSDEAVPSGHGGLPPGVAAGGIWAKPNPTSLREAMRLAYESKREKKFREMPEHSRDKILGQLVRVFRSALEE